MVRVCLQQEVEGESMAQVACLCLWEVAEEEEEGEKQGAAIDSTNVIDMFLSDLLFSSSNLQAVRKENC